MKLFIALALLISIPASADGPKFGPEFTFAQEHGRSLANYFDHLNRHLVINQPEKEKFQLSKYGEFTSPNGWQFSAKYDQGVIEVTMTPMTYEDYKKYAADIQDAVFESAYQTEHYAKLFTGGGHISIDFDYFLNEPLLLRNFLVDLINHSELAMGIGSYDTNNALALPLLSPHYIEDLKTNLEILDQDLAADETVDIYELARAFNDVNQGHSDPFRWFDSRGKNTAINFFHVSKYYPSQSRIELRSFRPQPNFQTFLSEIRLLSKRIEYLRKFKSPIPIQLEVQIDPKLDPQGLHKLTPPIKPRDALKAFYKYVNESGEKWSDHRSYIWPEWFTGGELKKFESSIWFKTREIKRVCTSLLTSKIHL